jgi:hydroxymethylpyrimidine pyrophosphatase-like HAD family hydrolase
VPDLESALAEDPIQVMYGGSVEEMEAVFPALEAVLAGEARIERTVYPRNGRALLDVIAAGVGKAEALAFLQNRYAIEPEETLAIGDNWNDREMLESAGIGYLMSNADPALLALPLPRLPSNDEDGVAQAIEKHILAR